MRKHNKILVTTVLAVTAFAVTACSSPSSDAAATAGKGASQQEASVSKVKDIHAAFFTPGSSNTYLQAGIASAKSYAAEQGFSIDIFDSQWDPQKQIDQVQTAITSGKYNAFAIEPLDGNLICASVKQALEAKIMVSAVGNAFCGRDRGPLGQMFMPGTMTVVNGQNIDIYKAGVDQIKKDNPDGAKVGIITGPSLSAYTVDMNSAAKAFTGKYEVLAAQATDYTTAQAYQAAQTMLQAHPDLNVIISNYSGMSRGVLQATAGTKVAVYDFGGDKWALQQVQSGGLKSTIMMLPKQETKYALQAIVEKVSGKNPPTLYDLTKDSSLPAGSPFVYKDDVAKFTAQY